MDLAQVDRVPGVDGQADRQRREVGLEERRVAGTWKPGWTPELRGDVGQVVVADAAVALGEVAEDVVAQAGVERQAAADPPVVLHETADVVRQEVAPRVALIEIGAAARRRRGR